MDVAVKAILAGCGVLAAVLLVVAVIRETDAEYGTCGKAEKLWERQYQACQFVGRCLVTPSEAERHYRFIQRCELGVVDGR